MDRGESKDVNGCLDTPIQDTMLVERGVCNYYERHCHENVLHSGRLVD